MEQDIKTKSSIQYPQNSIATQRRIDHGDIDPSSILQGRRKKEKTHGTKT
jgi:hypothetical protein